MLATAFSILMFAGFSACPAAVSSVPGGGSDDLEALYRSGIPFTEFLAAAEERKASWERHYAQGDVDPAAIARLAAVPGTWRVLAIAEDWCSDSVSTIPFLALLAERVENLELRIIDSEVGSGLMAQHPTPDGRGATPTVIVLNEAFENVGCWVERPAELQTWALGAGSGLGNRDFVTKKMAWYEKDGGRSTVDEIIALIEHATAGEAICPTG